MTSRRRVSEAEREMASEAGLRLDESPLISIQKLAAEVGRLKRRMLRAERRLGPPKRRGKA